MKKCVGCKENKAMENFSKNKTQLDGLSKHCRECRKKINHKYYKENGHKILKVKRPAYKKRNRKYILDYLTSHPCIDCGEKDVDVLEFDHLKDKRKDVCSLACQGYSLDSLIKEIEKCEVRCANCHRRKTRKQFKYTRGSII